MNIYEPTQMPDKKEWANKVKALMGVSDLTPKDLLRKYKITFYRWKQIKAGVAPYEDYMELEAILLARLS